MKQLNSDESYCLGMSLTIEALKCKPDCITSIYLSTKANRNKELDYLLELAKIHSIEVIYDDHVIEKYSLKENCYCIAFFNKFYSKLSTNKHIVCFEFKDFGQLGTILRSAVSFDFKDIVLINTDIDYFDPRVVRASMGSIFHVSIEKYKTLEEYLSKYKTNVYCFNTTNVNELKTLKPKAPYSLIISEKPDALNDKYKEGYYIKHKGNDVSLSALSSIVFNYCFEYKD